MRYTTVRADVIDNMLIEYLTLLINSSMFMDFLNGSLIREVYNYRNDYSNLIAIQDELQSLEKRKQHFIAQFENGIIEEAMYINGYKLFALRQDNLSHQLKSMINKDYILDQETENLIKNNVKLFVNRLSILLKNSKTHIEYKHDVINELVKYINLDNKTGEPEFKIRITQNLFTKMLGTVNDDIYENITFTIIMNTGLW